MQPGAAVCDMSYLCPIYFRSISSKRQLAVESLVVATVAVQAKNPLQNNTQYGDAYHYVNQA